MFGEYSEKEDREWLEALADLEESERNKRGMTLCPNCEGRSPPENQMIEQVNATGDLSGACGTCNNTHEIPLTTDLK